MTLYMLFLIIEIAMVLFGVYMGYRRGTGKALVRLCELAVIAVISLFVARTVAFSLVDKAKDMIYSMLDSSAAELISSSENAAAFIVSLTAALIAPIFFALIFGFFKLFTLIGFNFVAGKIAKKDTLTPRSRWIGSAIGALSGVLVCAVMLSPFFSVLYMAGSVPTREKESLCTKIGIEDDVADKVMEWLPVKVPMHPVSTLMSKLATTSTVEGIKFCAIDEAPEMLAMLNDFLESYEKAQDEGKDELSVIGTAISTVIPHMENSQFISGATSSVINSVGENIKNGNIDIGEGDPLSSAVADSVADILISVSPDNITENIEVIVGDGEESGGLIGVVSDLTSAEDIESFIKEGKAEELADILIEIESKPELSQTMESLKDIGMTMFSEAVLSEADSEMQSAYIDQIGECVNEILDATKGGNGNFENDVRIAAGVINGMLSEETQSPLSSGESELLAIFAVYYFCNDEYYTDPSGVTSADIEAFLNMN